MPAGPRIRTDNVFGVVSDNPLTAGATTLTSAGLTHLAAVSSAHAVIILDPLRTAGAPEIVIVTAHTGGSTSATISRGAYGTTARQHAAGTAWVHAPTIDDFVRVLTSSTRPSDPYEGQLIWEADTNRLAAYDGAAWREAHNPPAARVRASADVSHTTSGAWQAVNFDTEDWDPDALHSTVTNTSRLTAPVAGKYWVYGALRWAPNGTGVRILGIRKNGTGNVGPTHGDVKNVNLTGGDTIDMHYATEVDLVATDWVDLVAWQNTGGALAMQPASSGNLHFGMRWMGP